MNAFRPLQLLLTCLVLSGLVACQTMTPTDRIGQNPAMYGVLSPEHQVMVQQGRICEGMSKDAVYLAWGNPDTPPVIGQQNGLYYEKWLYVEYLPVVVDSWAVGGACAHRGSLYCAGGPGVYTTQVPSEVAWVMFQNNRVTAWERRK